MISSDKLNEQPTQDIDEKFMQLALREAATAFERDEVPVGAVIVHRGNIIGRAHNQREMLNDPTAHAEIIAITQAAAALESWRLEETTLYVTTSTIIFMRTVNVSS